MSLSIYEFVMLLVYSILLFRSNESCKGFFSGWKNKKYKIESYELSSPKKITKLWKRNYQNSGYESNWKNTVKEFVFYRGVNM